MKLEVTRKSFFFQGGYEYNTLPREIRSEKNHQNFKAILGNFIITKLVALAILYFILVSAHSVWTIAMCSVSNRYLLLNFSVQSGLSIAFTLV